MDLGLTLFKYHNNQFLCEKEKDLLHDLLEGELDEWSAMCLTVRDTEIPDYFVKPTKLHKLRKDYTLRCSSLKLDQDKLNVAFHFESIHSPLNAPCDSYLRHTTSLYLDKAISYITDKYPGKIIQPVIFTDIPDIRFDNWIEEGFSDIGTDIPIIARYLNSVEILRWMKEFPVIVLTGTNTSLWSAYYAHNIYHDIIYPTPYFCNNSDIQSDERIIPSVDDWVPDNNNWIPIEVPYQETQNCDRVIIITDTDGSSGQEYLLEKQLYNELNLASIRLPAIQSDTVSWKSDLGGMRKGWGKKDFIELLHYQSTIILAMKEKYNSIMVLDHKLHIDSAVFKKIINNTVPPDWHIIFLTGPEIYPDDINLVTMHDKFGEHVYKVHLAPTDCGDAIIINKRAYNNIIEHTAHPYGSLYEYLNEYATKFPCYTFHPGVSFFRKS